MFIEKELAESEAKLRTITEEKREAREELETCHTDIQILQGTLATERERAEALISHSLTDRDQKQQAEVSAVCLTFCHKIFQKYFYVWSVIDVDV